MRAQERLMEFDLDGEIMLIDDDAYYESFIGTTEINGVFRAVYDYDKMVEEYIAHYNCHPDEATEWIDYNVVRALSYYGEKAPIIINRFPE